MAEKSARYDALQFVHHCRAAGSARISREVQRTEKATPLQRRSASSNAPAKKRKRLRGHLQLGALGATIDIKFMAIALPDGPRVIIISRLWLVQVLFLAAG